MNVSNLDLHVDCKSLPPSRLEVILWSLAIRVISRFYCLCNFQDSCICVIVGCVCGVHPGTKGTQWCRGEGLTQRNVSYISCWRTILFLFGPISGIDLKDLL